MHFHEYSNEIIFILDPSNCNIDYIKTCNNDNIRMKSTFYIFVMIFLIFSVFINIHKYANMIRCTFDHRKKGLCLIILPAKSRSDVMFCLLSYGTYLS